VDPDAGDDLPLSWLSPARFQFYISGQKKRGVPKLVAHAPFLNAFSDGHWHRNFRSATIGVIESQSVKKSEGCRTPPKLQKSKVSKPEPSPRKKV